MEKLLRQSYAAIAHYSGLNPAANFFRELVFGPKLVVLAYHRVNDEHGDRSPYTVTTSQLDRHLGLLKGRYPVVSLGEVLGMVAGKRECVDSAVITFDDGYRDNYENAAPILEKHGMNACFFLSTNLVDRGTESSHPPSDEGYSGMTWKQVRELHARGFELGAHTRTHPTLPELALENARSEIIESKHRIEDEVMAPVRFFAYPGGKGGTHYNDRIRAIVEREFDICCTTDRGRNSLRKLDLFALRRICVQRWWSPFYFSRELDGTFDFVGNRRMPVRAGQ